MADYKYYKDYNRQKQTRISLNLSNSKDQDIIQAINNESPDNIQAGVKSLIRRAINNEE
jgi:hypothetical protein